MGFSMKIGSSRPDPKDYRSSGPGSRRLDPEEKIHKTGSKVLEPVDWIQRKRFRRPRIKRSRATILDPVEKIQYRPDPEDQSQHTGFRGKVNRILRTGSMEDHNQCVPRYRIDQI